jgi:hypothetical protein
MLHIAMNLVNTELGREYKKLSAGLTGLVKPEYIHSSLVILIGKDFSPAEMQTINQIANSASEKIANLTSFKTGNYVIDNYGYLMLETDFEGLEEVIAEMEDAFEDAGFDYICQRPFASTIVEGVFGTEEEVASAMDHMKSFIANESLKQGLCNKTFSMEGAVYSQAGYPKAALAGTVEVIKAFHEFKNEERELNMTNDACKSRIPI